MAPNYSELFVVFGPSFVSPLLTFFSPYNTRCSPRDLRLFSIAVLCHLLVPVLQTVRGKSLALCTIDLCVYVRS